MWNCTSYIIDIFTECKTFVSLKDSFNEKSLVFIIFDCFVIYPSQDILTLCKTLVTMVPIGTARFAGPFITTASMQKKKYSHVSYSSLAVKTNRMIH